MVSTIPARRQIMIGVAALLLGLYLICPYVFMIPMFFAIEHHWMPEAAFEKGLVVFAPLEFISNHVPAYRKMITAEGEFFSRLGWLPDGE